MGNVFLSMRCRVVLKETFGKGSIGFVDITRFF